MSVTHIHIQINNFNLSRPPPPLSHPSASSSSSSYICLLISLTNFLLFIPALIPPQIC